MEQVSFSKVQESTIRGKQSVISLIRYDAEITKSDIDKVKPTDPRLSTASIKLYNQKEALEPLAKQINFDEYLRRKPLLLADINDDDIKFTDRHKSPPGHTDDDKDHMTLEYKSDESVTHIYDDYSSRTWDKNGKEEK